MLAVHLAVSGAADSKRNRNSAFPASKSVQMNNMEGLPISKGESSDGGHAQIAALRRRSSQVHKGPCMPTHFLGWPAHFAPKYHVKH